MKSRWMTLGALLLATPAWAMPAFEAPEGLDSEQLFRPNPAYVAMNIDFAAAAELREWTERNLMGKGSGRLRNRGEAHITLVTPPELKALGRAGLTMPRLAEMAAGIQNSDITPLCIGRGVARDGEETYFVVVRSEGLIQLRARIVAEFERLGGDVGRLGAYYPHITLGFTERDLFESDGVIKDERSCVAFPAS